MIYPFSFFLYIHTFPFSFHTILSRCIGSSFEEEQNVYQ